MDNFDINFFITSFKSNGEKWTLLNFTANGCEFLLKAFRKRKLFPYILLDELRKTNPDFPKKCPFRKVVYYKCLCLYSNLISFLSIPGKRNFY